MQPTERIQTLSTLLAAEIRDYIRSEVKGWRKLPWLAVNTKGLHGGHKQPYMTTIQKGLWPIRTVAGNRTGVYLLFVDCETAEVVTSERKPVSDAEVLELSGTPEQIDVVAIIKKMKQEIATFESSFDAHVQKDAEGHRRYLRGMFHVTPTYKHHTQSGALH